MFLSNKVGEHLSFNLNPKRYLSSSLNLGMNRQMMRTFSTSLDLSFGTFFISC